MNYVFFDVECANCFNGRGKLCSFGYIYTDENFNIITKEDRLLNPNDKWDWFVLKKMIKYKKEEFYDSPTFQDEYQSIKNILTNSNHISFGFDVINDLKYINDDCERYGLPKIKTKSYDVQDFYKMYSGIKQRKSLSTIAKSMNIDFTGLDEHNSRDDAHITMLIMKEIANKLDVNSKELIELCDKGSVNSIRDDKNTNDTGLSFLTKLRKICKRFPKRNENPAICFSDTIKEQDETGRLNLITKILENNYNYTSKVSECAYYVKGKLEGVRDKSLETNLENGKDIKTISLTDLSKILNVPIDEYGQYFTKNKSETDNSQITEAFKKAIEKSGTTLDGYLKKLS